MQAKSISLETFRYAASLNLISDDRSKGLTDLQVILDNWKTQIRKTLETYEGLTFFPESELNSQGLNLFLLTLLLYNTDLTDSTGYALHLVKTKIRIRCCLSILDD